MGVIVGGSGLPAINWADILAMAAFVGLGFYASAEDVKTGLVPNRSVAIGLVMVLILLLCHFMCCGTEWFARYLLNALATCLAATLLYVVNVWAGGDCKLAVALALLFPHSLYFDGWGLFPTLPVAVLLMLAIGAVWHFLLLFWHFIHGRVQLSRAEVASVAIQTLWSYVAALSCIAAIGIAFAAVVPEFGLRPLLLVVIDFSVVWFMASRRLFDSKAVVGCLIVLDVAASLCLGILPLGSNPWRYVLVLILTFLRRITIGQSYETIPTADVRKGMILSTATTLKLATSRVHGLPGISRETVADRLTEDQARSVQQWGQSSRGDSRVTIVAKTPFAPFVFIGFAGYVCLGVF